MRVGALRLSISPLESELRNSASELAGNERSLLVELRRLPIPMTEVLAASITNHTGPLSVEGTVINEYRMRHGAANVFTFQAADDLRISRCQIRAWCTVRAGEQHGLDIRYDSKVDLIRDWLLGNNCLC